MFSAFQKTEITQWGASCVVSHLSFNSWLRFFFLFCFLQCPVSELTVISLVKGEGVHIGKDSAYHIKMKMAARGKFYLQVHTKLQRRPGILHIHKALTFVKDNGWERCEEKYILSLAALSLPPRRWYVSTSFHFK